jgi:hypothetical protein
MWKYAHLALITITQLYLTFVTFLKYYQFIYIMNNVISSLFKCYRCTYITYWMFLNKDITMPRVHIFTYFRARRSSISLRWCTWLTRLLGYLPVLALWSDSSLGRYVSPRRYVMVYNVVYTTKWSILNQGSYQ